MSIYGIDFGGPSSGIVHQDRLVLVGGGAVPDLLAASKTGDWTDFDEGGANPTASDGFWFQQTSSRGNEFHALVQQQGLLIFGEIGESAIPPGAFTAGEVSIRENSWIGSDTGRPPIIAGNLVVFLQRGGEDARGIVWNEQQLKYIAPSLLQLSGRVFENGRDLFYQPSTGTRGDTVYVVDEGGDLAVCLLRVGEDQPAWSRWETAGRVIAGAAPLGEAVFVVERNGEVALETLAAAGGDEFDCQVVLTDVFGSCPEWMGGLMGGENPNKDEPPWPLRARFVDRLGERHPFTEPFMIPEGSLVPVKTAGFTTLWDPALGYVSLEIGLRYERALETVQFVRRAQTGSSARVNPQRVLDCVADFVFGSERFPRGPEQKVFLSSVDAEIVPVSKGRRRPRKLRAAPPNVKTAVGERSGRRILTAQYPARLGWRDRIAVELRSEDHYEVAGVAYRVSA